MLLNLLLAFILFSNPGGAGSAMDPNGVTSNGVVLGDGAVVQPDPPPKEPPNAGMHIDSNGFRACYSACVDPNG